MRRLPNPWVLIPIIVAAVAGGAIGYFVTNASCAPDSCVTVAGIIGAIVGIGTAAGVGVVMVLLLKSLSEWREHADREILTVVNDDPPGPPTC